MQAANPPITPGQLAILEKLADIKAELGCLLRETERAKIQGKKRSGKQAEH
jgi:hypothetical protein